MLLFWTEPQKSQQPLIIDFIMCWLQQYYSCLLVWSEEIKHSVDILTSLFWIEVRGFFCPPNSNDDIGIQHEDWRYLEEITDNKILHNNCIVNCQSISPPKDGNYVSHESFFRSQTYQFKYPTDGSKIKANKERHPSIINFFLKLYVGW